MQRHEKPVDHVLDRMVVAVLGENAHFRNWAEALGIPANTIKTWRMRGEVPPGTLAHFAREWKVPLDWLLHGDPAPAPHLVQQPVAPYGLARDEIQLVENYRASPRGVREALQLVARIGSMPAGAPVPANARQMRSGEAIEPVSAGSAKRAGVRGKTKSDAGGKP